MRFGTEDGVGWVVEGELVILYGVGLDCARESTCDEGIKVGAFDYTIPFGKSKPSIIHLKSFLPI